MSPKAALRTGCALALFVMACSGGGDPSKPLAVRIVTPAATAHTSGGEIRFQVEVDGAYEAVDLARDGAVMAELVPPEPFVWRTADVADGTYRFVARARRGTEQALSAPLSVVVDRVKPKVVSVSPAAGTLQYTPYPTIEIAFDEAIDPASVAGLVNVHAASVDAAATVSVSASGTMLQIVPATWADPLEVVVAGVRDLAGNAMDAPFAVSYPVAASVIVGPRELGAGIRFSSVRVAPAPDGGAVVAAVTGNGARVWRVARSGAVTVLDQPLAWGVDGVDVTTDAAGNPTLAAAGYGGVWVGRWNGSAWVSLGGPLPGTTGTTGVTNYGWPGVVLDDSGAPVVSWMSLVYVDSTNYWWTANVARLTADGWQVLPGFHPDGRQSYDVSTVALVDGVPYLACDEGPKPGSDGPSASVVLRSWNGSGWQQEIDTGLQGFPVLSASGGRAALSVAAITPLWAPYRTVHVFTREPAVAWGEVTALDNYVDSALWNGRLEVPVAVAPGPADAVLLRTGDDLLQMEFRLPYGYWQFWNAPVLGDTRQVWPAIAVGPDGLYRIAHVERGPDADWLEVLPAFQLVP